MDNGDLLTIGTKRNHSLQIDDATLTKFDNSGNLIFQKVFNDDDYLIGKDLLVHDNLIFMLCTASRHVFDIMLIILDIEGNDIIRHNLGNNYNDSAEQLLLLNNEQILIVGRGVESNPEINLNIMFIKISDFETITSVQNIFDRKVIDIYPNPANRNSILKIGGKLKSGFILNSEGNMVFEISNTDTIMTENLVPGIYFIYGINIQNESVKGKIIISE